MNRLIIPALAVAIPAITMAQSPVEAAALTQDEMRGTARFMAMGGAFTALGGDLSVLGQNPAGIGVYNRSDIGVTLDIDMRSYKTTSSSAQFKNNHTQALCNNVAYVGGSYLGGTLRTFNWGVSYGRKTSFDRIVQGYNVPTETSLTNYIAAFSGGYAPDELGFGSGYNPYQDSDCDWLSILAYNSYMISPASGSGYQYQGLANAGSTGDAQYITRESGYVDEYNIDLGGNIMDLVYWGVGVGINDLNYYRSTYYSESISNATVVSGNYMVNGDAGFNMYNDKNISGTGANVKFGLIIKPINELRIGMAVHTPTWYSLNHSYAASTDYSYYDPAKTEDRDNPLTGKEDTDYDTFSTKLNTPWRLMFGAAAVLDNRAIVSLDYERIFYSDMSTKRQNYNNYFYGNFVSATDVNDAIDDYYQDANIIRLGLEYRVTPQFSARLGFNTMTSNVTKRAMDGEYEVMTSGTDVSYSFDKTTTYITAGVGYRYKAWYIDATYVHKTRKSEYHAYTDFDGFAGPMSQVTDNNNSLVFSTGFKF